MTRVLVASLLVLAVPFAVAACTADTTTVPDSPDAADAATTEPSTAPSSPDAAVPSLDASQGTDAATAEDTGKPVCNDLRNVAADVPELFEASEAPEATGGTLGDGTYVLVRATKHTGAGGQSGPTGATMRMTIRKTGTRYDSVFDGVARSAEIAFRGTEMTATTVCPGNSTMTLGYTATTSSLTVRFADGASTRVYVYEKR